MDFVKNLVLHSHTDMNGRNWEQEIAIMQGLQPVATASVIAGSFATVDWFVGVMPLLHYLTLIQL